MEYTEKIPPTSKRVFLKTPPKFNEAIRERTYENIKDTFSESHEIYTNQIKNLSREWDTERLLETNAAGMIFLASLFGISGGKKWFFLTGAVSGFLFWHALSGFCPPLPLIRALKIRTAEEISNEKMALKYLRGDFRNLDPSNVEEILRAVEKE